MFRVIFPHNCEHCQNVESNRVQAAKFAWFYCVYHPNVYISKTSWYGFSTDLTTGSLVILMFVKICLAKYTTCSCIKCYSSKEMNPPPHMPCTWVTRLHACTCFIICAFAYEYVGHMRVSMCLRVGLHINAVANALYFVCVHSHLRIHMCLHALQLMSARVSIFSHASSHIQCMHVFHIYGHK